LHSNIIDIFILPLILDIKITANVDKFKNFNKNKYYDTGRFIIAMILFIVSSCALAGSSFNPSYIF